MDRCFPHIVNLACKAILSAITTIDYAAEEAEDYVEDAEVIRSGDPIAKLRSLIRSVSL
jgi:hypothetical protein